MLAANSRMLNLLRAALPMAAATRFEIRELARDMTKLTPVAIHQHLARADLLPIRRTARPRPGRARTRAVGLSAGRTDADAQDVS